MTPDALARLIESGETLDVEFKGEEKRRLPDSSIVETVVCLANRVGSSPGRLLVGIEDDGRITGARPRHGEVTVPQRLAALVANRTVPPVAAEVKLVELDGCEIIVLTVAPAREPVGSSDGRFLRRVIGSDGKPACMPLHFYGVHSILGTRGQHDPSAQVLQGTSWKDLDPLEFHRFRRTVEEAPMHRGDNALLDLDDQALAMALGVAVPRNGEVDLRLAALLLFGKEQVIRDRIPTHEVAFQVLSGEGVALNRFVRWPLLRVMEEFEGLFRARNREEEILVGMYRIPVPDYPPTGFREGLANALVHRDYARTGAIHVQVADDRLAISSPGGLPEGVRLDNLLRVAPRPRNPLLADALKRAGVVERIGRGVDAIYRGQLRGGRPAPSYDGTDEAGVTLALPGGQANLDFVRWIMEEEQKNRPPTMDQLLILNEISRARQLTTNEVASLIQRSASDARGVLERMLDAGLVESSGSSRWRTFHLSAAAYRALGESAGYVRRASSETADHARLIQRYLEQYDRITRSEAVTLCHVTPPQATRLLGRLVKQGAIRRIGERRWTYYVLPDRSIGTVGRARRL